MGIGYHCVLNVTDRYFRIISATQTVVHGKPDQLRPAVPSEAELLKDHFLNFLPGIGIILSFHRQVPGGVDIRVDPVIGYRFIFANRCRR